MDMSVSKLKSLKSIVVSWEKQRKKTLKRNCLKLNTPWKVYMFRMLVGFYPREMLAIQYLEDKKMVIVKKEVETWRQKSRSIWLSQVDANTKLFHQFVDYRRIVNTVWEVVKDDDENIYGKVDLGKEEINYYKKNYIDPSNSSIVNQMRVIGEYPRFFSKEEGTRVVGSMTFEEIKKKWKVLKKKKV